MENQNTNTMAKSELETLLPDFEKFMEKERKEFNEMHSAFLEQHDFSSKPDVQTRSITAWTRQNIVLDTWNQFINCEAKMAEFAGWEKEGKGFRTFNDRRRCDIALDFCALLSRFYRNTSRSY